MTKYLNLKLKHAQKFQEKKKKTKIYFSMIHFVNVLSSFLVPKNFPPSTISIYLQLSKS